MTDHDTEIAALLADAVPRRELRADSWDAIVREAAGRAERRRARRWLLGVIPVSAAAAIAFVLALAWPFGGDEGGVLERALAAVGDGPVLHVVFRDKAHSTLIDLESGSKTPVYSERELWYDPDRGVHVVSRFGGKAYREVTYPASRAPADLRAIARLAARYREALKSREVASAEPGTIGGLAVYWITVRREVLPDVADGKLHEWRQQVAVSRESYEPVATRETRDGKAPDFTIARILEMEMLPSGQGDFRPKRDPREGMEVMMPGGAGQPITIEQARALLGRDPLSLGGAFEDLRLTRVGRLDYRSCAPAGRECESATGVALFYGAADADGHPDFRRPFVLIRQLAREHPLFHPAGSFVPPRGSVLVSSKHASLHRNGLYVAIDASSDELALAAARALAPIPGPG